MPSVDGTCEYVLDPDDPETWGGDQGDTCYVDEEILNDDGVWTCPHEVENGHQRCIFHLPLEAKSERQVLDAFLEILTSERGSVEERSEPQQFLGATFGRLDLQALESVNRVDDDLWLSYADIRGRMDFSETVFGGSVSFAGTTFGAPVRFTETTFESAATFGHATFGAYTSFIGARCQGEASFIEARFRGETMINKMTFEAEAEFLNATFEADASFFGGTTFEEPADFTAVTFEGETTFSLSAFEADVDFRFAEFASEAYFDEITFEGQTNFGAAAFEGPTSFSEAVFNDTVVFTQLSLRDAQFDSADLTDAVFSGATLHGVDFESALLSRASLFETDLRGAKLSGAVLGDVRIDAETRFLGRPGDGDDSPHTLSAIRSSPTCVYDPGYGDDTGERNIDKAKSVYRALEELARKHARPRLQARCFVRRQDLQKRGLRNDATAADASTEERLIAGARWGRMKVSRTVLLYGESPWRVIVWSLCIVGLFALLYPIGGWIRPTSSAPITYSGIPPSLGTVADSLYYSTLTYTSLGFGDFQPVGFGRLLTTLETGLGAVMLALLVFILGRRAAR